MQLSQKMQEQFTQLGQHIKKLREDRGISIKEMSEKTGIRKAYLKKIEDGIAYRMRLNAHLVKIAKAIKVNLVELFNYE